MTESKEDDAQQKGAKAGKKGTKARDLPEIRLAVPWGGDNVQQQQSASGFEIGHLERFERIPRKIQDQQPTVPENQGGHTERSVEGNPAPRENINALFITERTRLHETYIHEEAKTKRLTLILAAILFLAGCSAVLFAPAGRELLFNWIGGAILVVAAGIAGFKRVWGKSKGFELRADQDVGKK